MNKNQRETHPSTNDLWFASLNPIGLEALEDAPGADMLTKKAKFDLEVTELLVSSGSCFVLCMVSNFFQKSGGIEFCRKVYCKTM